MIHHVYANRSNIGDWLSARALQSLLPAGVPVRQHLCDEYFVAETLAALAEADAQEDVVLIGGGGLFMDYFMPFWRGFAALAPRLTFCIWGVGCCDAKDRASRPPAEPIRGIVARSRLTVVRDALTREYLDMPQLPPPVHCPSVLELHPPPAKQRKLLHAVHYEVTGPQRYEALVQLCREFAASSGREYLETNNEIRADSQKQLDGTLRLYADADVVVSTRLHGCLIGMATGCKVLAISGDRKVESLMESAGLGDWICDVSRIREIPRRLAEVDAQPSPADFLERVRTENRRVGRIVSQIVNERHGPTVKDGRRPA